MLTIGLQLLDYLMSVSQDDRVETTTAKVGKCDCVTGWFDCYKSGHPFQKDRVTSWRRAIPTVW